MKAVRPAADTHGQPAVMLAGDQAPRHREGVDERHQRRGRTCVIALSPFFFYINE